MKLGSETGSLINHLSTRGQQVEPVVGMGATICHWSDRSAGTVIEVLKIGTCLAVVVQGDKATRIDQNGMSDCQVYRYERDPQGGKATYKRLSSGKWVRMNINPDSGRWNMDKHGPGLSLGSRDSHYDYSF